MEAAERVASPAAVAVGKTLADRSDAVQQKQWIWIDFVTGMVRRVLPSEVQEETGCDPESRDAFHLSLCRFEAYPSDANYRGRPVSEIPPSVRARLAEAV